MYLPHTRRKTSCSLGIFLPVIFLKEDARAWFAGKRRISEAFRLLVMYKDVPQIITSFWGGVQTKMSWRSPLTSQYSRYCTNPKDSWYPNFCVGCFELLGGGDLGGGQIWKPYLVPNISFNFKDAMCQNVCTTQQPSRGYQEITAAIQRPSGKNSNHPKPIKIYQQPSRGHQEISATIQRPQGNNSSHPLGSNSKGPYTKFFLHF